MQAFIIWQVVFYKDRACQPIHTTDIESQMQVHKEPKKVRFSRSRPSINVYCLNRDFCYLSYNDLREEILCITSMLSIQK